MLERDQRQHEGVAVVVRAVDDAPCQDADDAVALWGVCGREGWDRVELAVIAGSHGLCFFKHTQLSLKNHACMHMYRHTHTSDFSSPCSPAWS